MTTAQLSSWSTWMPLANHLWQSTIFICVIWLLTLALKNNRAAVRYWLWFAASIKFVIPLSVLIALGGRLSWHTAASAAQPPQWSFVVDNAVQPFTATVAAHAVSAHTTFGLGPILIVLWLGGVAVGLGFWLRCWRQVLRACKGATPLPLGLPIPVLSSASQIEPGVFGIIHPVLLLPEGIESRLTSVQLDAVLAHEMAHVRRRDNLTAAIHLVVETLLWFFPAIWWLRARLVAEREHACDEEVLLLGSDAESYAEGILQVCKFYTESPVVCISGVSGADLKKRIGRIMKGQFAAKLTFSGKILLSAAAVAAVALPLALGAIAVPHAAGSNRVRLLYLRQANRTYAGEPLQTFVPDDDGKPLPSFEVASVKRHPPDNDGGKAMRVMMGGPDVSQLHASNVTAKMLIATAYGVREFQIAGGPSWIGSDRWDIDAKVEDSLAAQLQKLPRQQQQTQQALMIRSLLVDRFALEIARATKQGAVLALVVAKGGPKLKQVPPPDPQAAAETPPAGPRSPGQVPTPPPGQTLIMANNSLVTVAASAAPIANLVKQLSQLLGQQVVDQTGLQGTYQYTLQFSPQVGLAGMPPPPGADAGPDSNTASIFTALQEQIGLKLESTKGPVETITVDHIEEPSPN